MLAEIGKTAYTRRQVGVHPLGPSKLRTPVSPTCRHQIGDRHMSHLETTLHDLLCEALAVIRLSARGPALKDESAYLLERQEQITHERDTAFRTAKTTDRL